MKLLISLTPFIGLFGLASTNPTPAKACGSHKPREITIDQIKAGVRCCNELATNWADAHTTHIQTGIAVLKNIDGKCSVGAASCRQLVPVAESEIVICNNNPPGSPAIERNCAELATYAEDVIARCQHDDLVCGQAYDTALFSIIVRHTQDVGECLDHD